jgi:hypothetical protein
LLPKLTATAVNRSHSLLDCPKTMLAMRTRPVAIARRL